MRVERLRLEGDPRAVAARVRALAPAPRSVEDEVRALVARVREEGDAAVHELTRRFDTAGAEPPPPRVGPEELAAALAGLAPTLRAALELAAENVAAVARAGMAADHEVTLGQGQRIVLRELPVRRAAIYAPGGRAPYPSTVVMGAVTARTAGVEQVVVCAPPAGGDVHATTLAACALCGVTEVHRMGGAQAIAALAYGTASVEAVDVVVGPGNRYVTEAKRQVFGRVGIDGLAGPSELVVVLDQAGDAHLAALDLLAQGEHGPDSLVAALSPDPGALDAVAAAMQAAAGARPTVQPAPCALVETADLDGALALAEALAPEHLQLMGAGPERLAPRVRSAGCLFVGRSSATAFGDYVAGSNHVLPTGGAARFASSLSPRHFRRRMAEVHVGRAAGALAPAGATIARAEGFSVHAESMEARIGENPPS